MTYKIKIERGAELDVKDAITYYKEVAPQKIVTKFNDDFKERLKALRINPYYRFYRNGYRGLPFKNFPYIIFFQINETDKIVIIYSVFETHQNPEKI